ncbi:hypothetical protein ACFQZ4_45960 [Catellatospora coxensis]|uniref:Uncharacterized protein n=1 Tax=Catellatospora coxensis TaxID=310354 RepID=A0A8J3KMF1_9ACTN|nr:hypothetical protein [Catellatospora coxensis]GIG05682.1 hypothetical protein Cco03nite_23820 [Catellatospora coxensis]
MNIDEATTTADDVLDRLRQTDPRTPHFLPGAFGVGIRFTDEGAASYQQESVAAVTLADDVAEGTRARFDMLRTVWPYGVLCYEIFTLVGEHALLVIEQALRDRFMQLTGGRLVFVKNGVERHVSATSYEDVVKAARKPGKLRVSSGSEIAFNGMLDGLRTWARAEGLLLGQRNLRIEAALTNLRNWVAHPNGHQLEGPNSAMGTLRDVAEIINQLWGHRTPGGRLYPELATREIMAISWDPVSGDQYTEPAEHLLADDDSSGLRYLIVRGVDEPDHPGSLGLFGFDGLHETTRYPTQLLWGPGDRATAADWLRQQQPEPDQVDHFDHLYLLRHHGGRLYRPMRHGVAAGLGAQEREGTWYAVRADDPGRALLHVQNLLTSAGCDQQERCDTCSALHLATGSHADVLGSLRPVLAAPAQDVTAPSAPPRWRDIAVA